MERTMTTLAELLAQREALERLINETQKQEKKAAIAQVKEIITQHELTADDLFGKQKATARVEAKYKDPETGATWSGRGRAPKWLEGKTRAEFAI